MLQVKVNYPVDLLPRDQLVTDAYEGSESEVKVQDPYRVLEDPQAEITKQWVAQENNITKNFL